MFGGVELFLILFVSTNFCLGKQPASESTLTDIKKYVFFLIWKQLIDYIANAERFIFIVKSN